MRKHTLVWLFLFLSLILNSVSLLAQQTTGQINGTIFDTQGAAVSNAQISVVETNTGFTRTTNSGNAGGYNLPLLPQEITG